MWTALTRQTRKPRTPHGQGAGFMRREMVDPHVSGYSDGQKWATCKTVGSAYVGSNPTPATTYSPSSSGTRRDHRRWPRGPGHEPAHPLRLVQVARCLARSQPWNPDRTRSCAAPVLPGAVELEPPSGVKPLHRGVIAALACRFTRYAVGTWTRGGAVSGPLAWDARAVSRRPRRAAKPESEASRSGGHDPR
jgi:hypothetical protein